MQDSGQNGEAMHKGIMLSGQSVDKAADSVPASDNMQYVNHDMMRICLVDALADFVQLNWFMPPDYREYTPAEARELGIPIAPGAASVRIYGVITPDPSSLHAAPSCHSQANSTPLLAIVENK